MPSIFDPRLLTEIPISVAKAAIKSGAARVNIDSWEEYKFLLKSRVAHTHF
jgi:malate dehydrogenase (oxaloacetate-decarboxylating)(NADP+)